MMRRGFTLIELLVVVTIIVVLLSLLTPAIERAIYAAEMAVCMTNKRTLALSVITYTSDFKRWYPHRPGVHAWPTWPGNVQRGVPRYDDRPTYRPYFDLNRTLNCPLIASVDIEGGHDDSAIFSTYNLWFGFQYRNIDTGEAPEKGMFRRGDRWAWNDRERQHYLRSNILASVRYFHQNNGDRYSASHPGDTYTEKILDNQTEVGFKFSLARWDSDTRTRGPIDITVVFDDGAAGRYDAVKQVDDERMARVPEYSDGGSFLTSHEFVPKR
jgi:prepilin-type N-terminal cleavage/methylation domain-containing protein